MSAAALAQSNPAAHPFEVASVKLHEGPGRVGITTSGTRWTAEAKTLPSLIVYAYDLKPYQVADSPALQPFGDSFYDVVAKAEGDAAPSTTEFRGMLQLLLASRFHLAFHREAKEMPVYALVVGKNGVKFHESAAGPEPSVHYAVSGRTWMATAAKATAQDLLKIIDNSIVDRPVIDKTGLTGEYDIRVTFTPQIPPYARNPDPDDIPIFSALQDQLGLRLEPQKAPIEVLVVDHVEKPSAN
jgi:uncharacterized protein (TIGR03435 family)